MASFPSPYLSAVSSSSPSFLSPLASPSGLSPDAGALPLPGLAPLSGFPSASSGSFLNPYAPPPISGTHTTSGGVSYSLTAVSGPGLPCPPSFHYTTPFLLHSGRVGRTPRREDDHLHFHQPRGSSGLRTVSRSSRGQARGRQGTGEAWEEFQSKTRFPVSQGEARQSTNTAENLSVNPLKASLPLSSRDAVSLQHNAPRKDIQASAQNRESSLCTILNRVALSCCESPENYITPRHYRLSGLEETNTQEGHMHGAQWDAAPLSMRARQGDQEPPLPSDRSSETPRISSCWCLTGAPSSASRRSVSIDHLYLSSKHRGRDPTTASTSVSAGWTAQLHESKDPQTPQSRGFVSTQSGKGGGGNSQRRAYSVGGREIPHLSFPPLSDRNCHRRAYFQQVIGDRSSGAVSAAGVKSQEANGYLFVPSPSAVPSPAGRGRATARRGHTEDAASRNTSACTLWACCCREEYGTYLDASHSTSGGGNREEYRGRSVGRDMKGGRYSSSVGGHSSSLQGYASYGGAPSSQFRTASERRWGDSSLTKDGRGGGGKGTVRRSSQAVPLFIPRWFSSEPGREARGRSVPPFSSSLGERGAEGVKRRGTSGPSVQQIEALCQVLFVGVSLSEGHEGASAAEGDGRGDESRRERMKKALVYLTSRLVGLAMDVAALMRLLCGGNAVQLRALLRVLQRILLAAGEELMRESLAGGSSQRKEGGGKELRMDFVYQSGQKTPEMSAEHTLHPQQGVENLLLVLRDVLLGLIGGVSGKQQLAPSSSGQFLGTGVGSIGQRRSGLDWVASLLRPLSPRGRGTSSLQDADSRQFPGNPALLQLAPLLISVLSPSLAGKAFPSGSPQAGSTTGRGESSSGEGGRTGGGSVEEEGKPSTEGRGGAEVGDAIADLERKREAETQNESDVRRLEQENEQLEDSLESKRKRLAQLLGEAAELRWLCEHLKDWKLSHKKRAELYDSLLPLLRRLRSIQGLWKRCNCLYHREEDKLGWVDEKDGDVGVDPKASREKGFRHVLKVTRETVAPDVQPVGYADNVFFASLRSSCPITKRPSSPSPAHSPARSLPPRPASPSPSRSPLRSRLKSRAGSDARKAASLPPPVHHAASLPVLSKSELAEDTQVAAVHRSKTISPSARASPVVLSRDGSSGSTTGLVVEGGVRTPRSQASFLRGSSPRPTSPSASPASARRAGTFPVPVSATPTTDTDGGGQGDSGGDVSKRRQASAPVGGTGKQRGLEEEDENRTKLPGLPRKSHSRRSRSPSPNVSCLLDTSPASRKADATWRQSSRRSGAEQSRFGREGEGGDGGPWPWGSGRSSSSSSSPSHSLSLEEFVRRGGSKDSSDSSPPACRGRFHPALDQGRAGEGGGRGGNDYNVFPGGQSRRRLEPSLDSMKDSNSDDQGMKVEQEAYRQAEAFLDTNENQQVFPPDHSNEAFKDCVNFKHLVPNSAKGSLSRALADPDSVPSAKKLDDRRLKTMLTFVEGVVKLLAKSNKNKPVLSLVKPIIQVGEHTEVEQCDLSIHLGMERLRRLLLVLSNVSGTSGPSSPSSLDNRDEFLRAHGQFLGLESEGPRNQNNSSGKTVDDTTFPEENRGPPPSPGEEEPRSPSAGKEGGMSSSFSFGSLLVDGFGRSSSDSVGFEGGAGGESISSQETENKKQSTFFRGASVTSHDLQTNLPSGGELEKISRGNRAEGEGHGDSAGSQEREGEVGGASRSGVGVSHDVSDASYMEHPSGGRPTELDGVAGKRHSGDESSGEGTRGCSGPIGREGPGEKKVRGDQGEAASKQPETDPSLRGGKSLEMTSLLGKGKQDALQEAPEMREKRRKVSEDALGDTARKASDLVGGHKTNKQPSDRGKKRVRGEGGGGEEGLRVNDGGLNDEASQSSCKPIDSPFSSRCHSPPSATDASEFKPVGQYSSIHIDARQFPTIPPLQSHFHPRSNVGPLPVPTRPGAGLVPTSELPSVHRPLGGMPDTHSGLSSTLHGGSGVRSSGEMSSTDISRAEPGSMPSSSSYGFTSLLPLLQTLPEGFDISQLALPLPPSPASMDGTRQKLDGKGKAGEERKWSTGPRRIRWVPCVVWAPCAVPEGEEETAVTNGICPVVSDASSRSTQRLRLDLTRLPAEEGQASEARGGSAVGTPDRENTGKDKQIVAEAPFKKDGEVYADLRSSHSVPLEQLPNGVEKERSDGQRSGAPRTALVGREGAHGLGAGGQQGSRDEERGRELTTRQGSVRREGMPAIFVSDVNGCHQQGGVRDDHAFSRELCLTGKNNSHDVYPLPRRGMSLEERKTEGQGDVAGSGAQPQHAKTHPFDSTSMGRAAARSAESGILRNPCAASAREQQKVKNESARLGLTEGGKHEHSEPGSSPRIRFFPRPLEEERQVDDEDGGTSEGEKSQVYADPRSRQGLDEVGDLGRPQSAADEDNSRMTRDAYTSGGGAGGDSNGHGTGEDSRPVEDAVEDEVLAPSRQWTGKSSLDGGGDDKCRESSLSSSDAGEDEELEGEGDEDEEEALKEQLEEALRELEELDHEVDFTESLAQEAEEVARTKAAEKDELEKQLEEEEKREEGEEEDDEEGEEEGGDEDDESGEDDEEDDDDEGEEEEEEEEEEEDDNNEEEQEEEEGEEEEEEDADGRLERLSDESLLSSMSQSQEERKKARGDDEDNDEVLPSLRKTDGKVRKAASWGDSLPTKRLPSGADERALNSRLSSSSLVAPKGKRKMARTDSSKSTGSTSVKGSGSTSSSTLGKGEDGGSRKSMRPKKGAASPGTGASGGSAAQLKRSATVATTRSGRPLDRKATRKLGAGAGKGGGGGGGRDAEVKKKKKKTAKGSKETEPKKKRGTTTTTHQKRAKKKLSRKKKRRLARKAKLAEAARKAAQAAALAADAPRVLRAHIEERRERANALRAHLEAKKARLELLLRKKEVEEQQQAQSAGTKGGGGGGGVRRMTTEASPPALGAQRSSLPSPRYSRWSHVDAASPDGKAKLPTTTSSSPFRAGVPSPAPRSPAPRLYTAGLKLPHSHPDEESTHRRPSASGAGGGGWIGAPGGGGGHAGSRRSAAAEATGGSSHSSSHDSHYLSASPGISLPGAFSGTGGIRWRRPPEEAKGEAEPPMIPKRKSTLFERIRPKTYILSEGKGLEGGGIVRTYKDWVRMYYGEERVKQIWGELAAKSEGSPSPPAGRTSEEGADGKSKGRETEAEASPNGHHTVQEEEAAETAHVEDSSSSALVLMEHSESSGTEEVALAEKNGGIEEASEQADRKAEEEAE